MGADELVVMQDAFEHANCALQNRYVKNALIPWRCIETVDTVCAMPAGETQREVLLIAAEKTHAKSAVGEYRIVSVGIGINTDQQAGRLHADRGNRTDRPPPPSNGRSGRYNGDAARQISHGLAKLNRLDGLNIVHPGRRLAIAQLRSGV
ncbi:hypothetical protein CP49_36875 [Bradyrhizobium valentinum]|uniref:Uncharacterized protein n=1 Tax=Bradyrhizobium valentinum TaxID=1518501 RepID=A0A0R3LIP8_9BRAD|nr:hypothetical protein CP49_36875 [Bradyrhizobium valentinum]